MTAERQGRCPSCGSAYSVGLEPLQEAYEEGLQHAGAALADRDAEIERLEAEVERLRNLLPRPPAAALAPTPSDDRCPICGHEGGPAHMPRGWRER